jgi:uncharacterized protein YjgD (DUF1641 family)
VKSKRLIELLQKEDPSGELDVTVENEDIFSIDVLEGYWDGCYEILERDETKQCYNVTGAQYRSDGTKLRIRTLGIYDALLNNPNLPVKVVDIFNEKRMEDRISTMREDVRNIIEELDQQIFYKVMNKIKDGHRIFQKKEDKVGVFFVMFWDKNDKKRLVSGECKTILKSGFFKHFDHDDKLIEWKLSF